MSSVVGAEGFEPAALSTQAGDTDKVCKAGTNEDQRNVDKIEYSARNDSRLFSSESRNI